jgi:enoyl-CoA hydratase
MRPDHHNAINVEMADELEACLTGLQEKPDPRVLIVTGEGPACGAGADLKERATLTPEQQKSRDSVLRSIEMIEAFHAPVIAMIMPCDRRFPDCPCL